MRTFLSLLLIPVRCAWGHAIRDASVPRILAVLAAASCLSIAPTALAQEDEEDEEDQPAVVEDASGAIEEVVVTGSRLKRDTYTSVAPLQIITGEVSREAGVIDAEEIVQKSTVAAGAQIDVTFSGFVLDDGPGTQTANLRGLGSNRTLLLVNGRRMGPAGVEGAPTSPDLGLIPGSLVQQYDLLLDGASSIYGSDAIAGVANVILRKDFDGLEVETFPSRPSHAGGDQDVLAVTWGKNFDRGFIGIGAEYNSSDPVTYADRPWTAGCSRNIEIDEGGRTRTEPLYYPTVYGMDMEGCGSIFPLSSRIVVPLRGSVYYTPGRSNGGWPSFSESESWGFPIDNDGDGEPDVNYRDHSLNGRRDYAELYPTFESQNYMVFGEYTFDGEMNLTPFFELGYVENDIILIGDEAQIFQEVPARNPFNICNPEGRGVDCGLASDALLLNPNFIEKFNVRWAGLCAAFGIPNSICGPVLYNAFGLTVGPMGPQPTTPIVTIRGDRSDYVRYLEQFRYVAGVTGDLPMLNFGSLSDWSFEFAYVHTRSDGTVRRAGIREDRLLLSLGSYSINDIPCENSTETPMAFDTAPGCVPVNMFARSLYSPLVGDFETQAERDYVFDDRDFATEYRQTVVTYYMTGSLFQLPAGGVSAGFGLEHREDQITSIPDHVARDGLFWGFFSDGGAVGSKDIQEAFGEVELPILAGQFLASELTVNLSARWTKDEYGGSAWTGSGKIAYRPIDSLLIRATGGTSFRAPNLRELFLQAQTGFLTVFDPCLLPEAAINDVTDEYEPELDEREPHVLDNCRANGVDPTTAHNNGFNAYSVEVAAGGALDLKDETSESITAGIAWEQPFTNAFDLTIGASYYQIEIDNTVIEPSAGYIVNNCYYSETGTSPFCGRITRGELTSDGRGPFIEYLDRGFINRDNETARGVDFNIAFDTTFTAFDRPFELGVDINAHRVIERTTLFVDDEGIPDFNQFQREWYFPEYRGQGTVRLDYDRWRVSWGVRYVSAGRQDRRFVDAFSDIYDNGGTGFTSDTCLGPPDDLLCRDQGDAPSYLIHSLSGWYSGNTWAVGFGARNLFDEAPPMVDATEGPTTLKNIPLGMPYDLDGRTLFLSASIRFFQGG
ncbi:MAG: TonB-dependent receptor [Gammaproteobacteria bacterium]|nr:TonB-dependent receptor [Gammaproteobacteria bacterium]